MTETHVEFTVRLPSMLHQLAQGQSELTVEIAPELENQAVSVARILDAVTAQYSVLGRRLRDETGAQRRHVNIYVDGEEIRRLNGLATEVTAVREIVIIQSVAGG
ncbi:MoaD/ThiS family protein [Pseudarthrobacter sp. J1738]|uniref:MoaD/ThiS family protein n=1 Tax=unclassified Pseudarthrobacter TaxID=2647000 RepID=UPI003D2B97BF